MTDDAPQWLSTNKAADYLGMTLRTLYRLIDAGDLSAYKFGRVIRLKQSDVDSFIEASKIEPGTLKHLYPEAAPKPDDDEDRGDGEDGVE